MLEKLLSETHKTFTEESCVRNWTWEGKKGQTLLFLNHKIAGGENLKAVNRVDYKHCIC